MITNDIQISHIKNIQDILDQLGSTKNEREFQGDLKFFLQLQSEETQIRFQFNSLLIISSLLHEDVKINSQSYINSNYFIERTSDLPQKSYKVVPANITYIGKVHFALFGKHYISVLEDASIFARRKQFPRGAPGDIKHEFDVNCRDYSDFLKSEENKSFRDVFSMFIKENGGSDGMPQWAKDYHEYQMNMEILS